jgi:mono/diheme cytochrome c family protein
MTRVLVRPLAGCLLLLSLVAHAQMGMMGRGMGMNMSMRRHHYAMMNGIDPRYGERTNPLPDTPDNVARGKKLYEENCALCHGAGGLGNGEAGKNLDPPPANIAAFTKMPMASDGYLLWTISEGGVPVGSAMPPFKDKLTDDQIWKIVLYVRGL